MIQLIGLKTCSTCRAVEKQLKVRQLSYQYYDLRQQKPTVELIQYWLSLLPSDMPLETIVNRNGNLFRELDLKERWQHLTEHDKINLLASNGMLVKRPILIADEQIYVGKTIEQFFSKNIEI